MSQCYAHEKLVMSPSVLKYNGREMFPEVNQHFQAL